MLFCDRAGQRYAVTQPMHAAVSHRLALAWGNETFGGFAPRQDVVLGTLLHDLGWLDWELEPTLNESTGLPRTFMQIPTQQHLAIWGPASRLARPFGRYVSMLVSMHGTGLYAFHDYSRDTDSEAAAARAFVQREENYQQEIVAEMAQDPATAPYVTPEAVARNRKLVAVWDIMSLAVCSGASGERTIQNVPTATEPVTLTLRMDDSGCVVIPWPFNAPQLTVSFEARALNRTFDNEEQMRAALDSAPWTMLSVALRGD